MKNLLTLLLVAFLTACGSKAPSIEGKWQLESVSGEQLSEAEKQSTMLINSDGTLEMTMGDRIMKGTWKLSDDKKTLTLTRSEDGDQKDMKDLEITEEKLSFKERDDVITFKRLK